MARFLARYQARPLNPLLRVLGRSPAGSAAHAGQLVC